MKCKNFLLHLDDCFLFLSFLISDRKHNWSRDAILDQASVPAMVALAAEVQQTQQKDHDQVHHDGEQDGSQDLQVQLRAQLSTSSERHGKWDNGQRNI